MKMSRFVLMLICMPLAVSVGAGVEMKPFPMDFRDNTGGLVNLSFLLDAPAGGKGFIGIRDGHLAAGDGSRLRIWGVNFTAAACFPSKEDAPVVAALLARFGFNCVRFHFMDSNWSTGLIPKGTDNTRSLDAANLDRLDFFIAQLKKRGIYADINLNVGRNYRKGDGVVDYQSIGLAKAITYFDERLVELQKEYARQLLTHVNPYTKTTYANEPAVAIVELLNENSLVEAWFSGRLLGKYAGRGSGGTWQDTTAHYAELLTRKYNDWLAEHLTKAQLAQMRKSAGVGPGEMVPRLTPDEFTKAPHQRFQTEATFYMDVENRFFQSMYEHLKKTLGVHALVVGSSDHNHYKSGYPLLTSVSKLDVVDGHVYWQHPSYGKDPKTGAQTFTIKNTPMVNDPLNSTIVQLSRSAVAGKPYTVSETNHPFPSEYACEGIGILAAYAGFQDWDGIFLYTFEHANASEWGSQSMRYFEIGRDPVKMTNAAAGALMFLRSDIEPARETIERSYTLECIRESIRLPSSERPLFTPGFPKSIPLIHSMRIGSFDGGLKSYPQMPAADVIAGDTGQLKWRLDKPGKGLVTIETDRAEALIGFVKDNKVGLKHLSADIENRFCSIILCSLDGRAIAGSKRLLLVVTARSANAGMKWNPERTTLLNWGSTPAMIEPVKGLITLRGLEAVRSVKAIPLNTSGKPLADAERAENAADGQIITIGEVPTTWYLIDAAN